MHTKLTNHPLEQVIAAIQALDLEPVKLRVMDPKLGEGWSREYAESIEQAYKNYLTMLAKYPDDAEDILLSEDVDEFWHTHILQTIKYTEDCERVFGKYLHHAPHIGEVTPADLEKRIALAEKTRRLYQGEFGNEQDYNAAWSGVFVKVENATMPSPDIRVDSAAMATIKDGNEAIRVEGAGYSGARIRAEGAAYSGARIRAENAAYSGARIRAENAAYSGARIRAENAAYSGARIQAEDAAYSGARIRVESAAQASLAATA